MIERVLPGASYVEIIERKKKIQQDLRGALYLYQGKFIVTSIAGLMEAGEPTVLSDEVTDQVIGEAICDHLLKYDPKTPLGTESHKLSDWRAYRASGAPSARSFESHCWMVYLSTIGDNSVVMRAQPRKSLYLEISVEGVARPKHYAVGATLRRTLKGAQELRNCGLI